MPITRGTPQLRDKLKKEVKSSTKEKLQRGSKLLVVNVNSCGNHSAAVLRKLIQKYGWVETKKSQPCDLLWTDRSHADKYRHFRRVAPARIRGNSILRSKINLFPDLNRYVTKAALAEQFQFFGDIWPNDFNFKPREWLLPNQTARFHDEVEGIVAASKAANRTRGNRPQLPQRPSTSFTTPFFRRRFSPPSRNGERGSESRLPPRPPTSGGALSWANSQRIHSLDFRERGVGRASPRLPGAKTYILKPSGGSQGAGIALAQSWADVEAYMKKHKTTAVVAQDYISDPLLINGHKFDLRIYVLLESLSPLRAHVFRDGLARLCTEKYESPNAKNLKNVFVHLTNYSINKDNPDYKFKQPNSLEDSKTSDKRSIDVLLNELEASGTLSKRRFWDQVDAIVSKTLIGMLPSLWSSYVRVFSRDDASVTPSPAGLFACAEPAAIHRGPSARTKLIGRFKNSDILVGQEQIRDWVRHSRGWSCLRGSGGSPAIVRLGSCDLLSAALSGRSEDGKPSDAKRASQSKCFQLLGFDVIVDSNLKPWLLEVNSAPSMTMGSNLDTFIKTSIIEHALLINRLLTPRDIIRSKTLAKQLTLKKALKEHLTLLKWKQRRARRMILKTQHWEHDVLKKTKQELRYITAMVKRTAKRQKLLKQNMIQFRIQDVLDDSPNRANGGPNLDVWPDAADDNDDDDIADMPAESARLPPGSAAAGTPRSGLKRERKRRPNTVHAGGRGETRAPHPPMPKITTAKASARPSSRQSARGRRREAGAVPRLPRAASPTLTQIQRKALSKRIVPSSPLPQPPVLAKGAGSSGEIAKQGAAPAESRPGADAAEKPRVARLKLPKKRAEFDSPLSPPGVKADGFPDKFTGLRCHALRPFRSFPHLACFASPLLYQVYLHHGGQYGFTSSKFVRTLRHFRVFRGDASRAKGSLIFMQATAGSTRGGGGASSRGGGSRGGGSRGGGSRGATYMEFRQFCRALLLVATQKHPSLPAEKALQEEIQGILTRVAIDTGIAGASRPKTRGASRGKA